MNATSEWIITHCATPESQGVIATQITPIFQPPLDRRQVLVKQPISPLCFRLNFLQHS